VTPPFSPDVLATSLHELVPGYPDAALAIALSGGVDSMALLHAARALALTEPRLRLRAVHVDHGLQPASKEWAVHCRNLCERLQVPLTVIELALEVAKGDSVEAEARRARYAALASALEPGECLLTAHHADDQLETALLQLFRGAGVAGLSAMPRGAVLGKGLHLRPLLEVGRDQLVAYATVQGLEWVEDPMNTESRYDRAYLRHEVLPAVRARWPAVARTVGRSVRHFAEARSLLEALAEADGRVLVDPGGRLEIAGLAALSRERQVNVLRWWIVGQGLGVPAAARLESILRDVVPARDDAQPTVTWPSGEVRRYRGRLYAMWPLGPLPPDDWQCPISPGQAIELPCRLGSVVLQDDAGSGLAPEYLEGGVALGFRSPGARMQPAGCRKPRTLKNLFQEAGIVPWMRPRLPLLHRDGELLAVANLWVAAGTEPRDGGRRGVLTWSGAPALR
jgi:tRNA(Ile)-lysidine synthase